MELLNISALSITIHVRNSGATCFVLIWFTQQETNYPITIFFLLFINPHIYQSNDELLTDLVFTGRLPHSYNQLLANNTVLLTVTLSVYITNTLRPGPVFTVMITSHHTELKASAAILSVSLSLLICRAPLSPAPLSWLPQ